MRELKAALSDALLSEPLPSKSAECQSGCDNGRRNGDSRQRDLRRPCESLPREQERDEQGDNETQYRQSGSPERCELPAPHRAGRKQHGDRAPEPEVRARGELQVRDSALMN